MTTFYWKKKIEAFLKDLREDHPRGMFFLRGKKVDFAVPGLAGA